MQHRADHGDLRKLLAAGIKSVKVIHTNELDCGDYVSQTLRSDSSTNAMEALVEIYRMMRLVSHRKEAMSSCSRTCSSPPTMICPLLAV